MEGCQLWALSDGTKTAFVSRLCFACKTVTSGEQPHKCRAAAGYNSNPAGWTRVPPLWRMLKQRVTQRKYWKRRLIALLLCRSLSTSLITDQTENAVSSSSHLTLASMVKQVTPPPPPQYFTFFFFFFTSLQIAAFPKFHFFPPLILPPGNVLTHCHFHTCLCVTSFCCSSCVCFAPMPLLAQTALAQKATELHVLPLGSIFRPFAESRPECCNSCSAISVNNVHVVNAHTCTRECPYK